MYDMISLSHRYSHRNWNDVYVFLMKWNLLNFSFQNSCYAQLANFNESTDEFIR